MKNLSNWRSVRLWQSQQEAHLRQRFALRLHGLAIGTLVMAVMWGTAHLQMVLGADSLALRYLVTLGVGYLTYLLILRIWAAALLGRGPDVADPGLDVPLKGHAPSWQAGGGGDFAGGGATGDFSGPADVAQGAGDLVSGAFDVAAGADEGAVVVVPVLVVFLVCGAVFLGSGALLLTYFGWEALLTVAVELAFSYASARTAVRVMREGWLNAAVRLTWKPLLGAALCAVLLGAVLDHFVPQAQSLPHALKLLRSGT